MITLFLIDILSTCTVKVRERYYEKENTRRFEKTNF